jgi:Baseplate J-like protein
VFDSVGTLALRLDSLKEGLPADEPLRATLGNLVRTRLSPVLRQLIGFYLAGDALGVIDRTAQPAEAALILGRGIESFDSLLTGPGLSPDWPQGVGVADWAAYQTLDLTEPTTAFGTIATDVARVNHLATHNFFTAACETFLGGYARLVEDAGEALRASFQRSGHQPHYALFLAFLRLFDYARGEVNTLAQKHLDFYYRRVLQLAERPAVPSQAHVLAELAKHVDSHLLEEGTLLKAGRDVQFSLDRDLVANKAAVTELKSLYRHHNSSPSETLPHLDGRIFASPVTNEGESWHPFAKKTYADGQLTSIDMPPAEIGFAIASHHLWLAEGTRAIEVQVGPPPSTGKGNESSEQVNLRCRLTTQKGWLEKQVNRVDTGHGGIAFRLGIDANDPAITPYDPKVHGYGFDTAQPVLLVTLQHPADAPWSYALLAATPVTSLTLFTGAWGMKTLAVSNDQGPVDAAKPFLAFGSTPTSNSSLVVGSKEAFQKAPTSTWLVGTLMATPVANGTAPKFSSEYLDGGTWHTLHGVTLAPTSFEFSPFTQPPVTTPDLTPNAPYSTTSRGGFIRLKLDRGYGTDTYPVALAAWVAQGSMGNPPTAPVLPQFSSLEMGYDSVQNVNLAAPTEATGRFFHITPFGHAEQHAANVPLVPKFVAGPNEPADGEFYLGVAGLLPPQNLALLFQVADGTANPLAVKPEHHLRWSYLRGNEWAPFPADAVNDLTDGLLASGIVTLAVPADATTEHTLMPRGQHWIRIAVASATDAVCRLLGVAAQAARATSRVPEGSPTLTVDLPGGTISKLEIPDAAVKSISQPYPTFGGRPVEDGHAFATRVSERLRHKDRAITLWDYEHLVLEAFPGIYQARCLNHTLYDPTTCGVGEYRELAPGHVTVVTIPDLAVPNPRDPLRPFTSLGVLGEIERFLSARMSCFAQLHVRNPQFEEVRVALRVRLRAGVDETFHLNRLKQEITEFLSPWAYRAEARPEFNGKVHKSVLVNFIEERPYVDYVSDVQLFRKLPDATTEELFAETVVGSRAISILVSAPAAHHTVEAIPASAAVSLEDCDCVSEVIV